MLMEDLRGAANIIFGFALGKELLNEVRAPEVLSYR
jgi:hypothetical protein